MCPDRKAFIKKMSDRTARYVEEKKAQKTARSETWLCGGRGERTDKEVYESKRADYLNFRAAWWRLWDGIGVVGTPVEVNRSMNELQAAMMHHFAVFDRYYGVTEQERRMP